MFYDVYCKLCEEHGEKPFSLPLKLGMKSNSAVAQWKTGSVPRPSMLQKIADYFGVTVGFLLDGENAGEEKTASVSADGLSATRYSQLNEENQALVDALIEKLLNSQSLE